MLRIVADLGNSRLKWGTVGPLGRVEGVVSLPVDDPLSWERAWDEVASGTKGEAVWAVASVNPPAAARLSAFLKDRSGSSPVWFRSGADIRVRHALEHPETTGADRALAVAAAIASRPEGRQGLVVLCGTAITVETIAAEGVWLGGAIAAGLSLTAQALHTLTAQLPLVAPRASPPPPAWGNATRSALEAGVFWGVVGGVREILTRQAADLRAKSKATVPPWVVWSGGDAPALAAAVEGDRASILPDLVLHGLAAIAYPRHAPFPIGPNSESTA